MDEQQVSASIAALTSRLRTIEAKVDFILKELKIDFVDNTQEPYAKQVNALVAQGKVLDAIRYYREQTGADMESARAYVEGLPKPQK